MRTPTARLIAAALAGVVVSLGAYVALWNLDTEVGHGTEPCSDFTPHLHLPFGWVIWS